MKKLDEQARRFPLLDLAHMDVTGLDVRDAALAQAIEHAALRRWLTLVAVIQATLSRPWDEVEPRIQAALLAGAAQLLLMDRIPDHAIVSEAVEWCKRNLGRRGTKAGGLVNAVLRKVAKLRGERMASTPSPQDTKDLAPYAPDEMPLHDGRILKLTQPVFDPSPVPRLAQQTSHPEALIAHWLTALGPAKTQSLALHSMYHAPIVLHELPSNEEPQVTSAGRVESELIEDALEPPQALEEPLLQPHDEPGFSTFSGSRAQLLQALAQNPRLIVQDPTSAAPALATRNLSPAPRIIIDVCAGKGTKTRQLAALHPQARIIAADIDESKVASLQEQFRGHPRVDVIAYRALAQMNGQADFLLLDVPCSNTGVLARRVAAKYRFSKQALEKLTGMQRQIIADSLALLAPAGHLLYSTCSIEQAENEQQAQWITKWHPMRIVQSRLKHPQGMPGEPPHVACDGGYFALLRRESC